MLALTAQTQPRESVTSYREAPLFTGIIAHAGTIAAVKNEDFVSWRIRIACEQDVMPPHLGVSIAVAGICLTASAIAPHDEPRWFEADLSPETIARTTAGGWSRGMRVNLERPLRVGDELGGHLVSGHVDGTARLESRVQERNCERFRFAVSPLLSPMIAEKGSVAVDGVSLTVAKADRDAFEVSVIPHTLSATTLAALRPGDDSNLEVDPLARHVARLQEFRND